MGSSPTPAVSNKRTKGVYGMAVSIEDLRGKDKPSEVEGIMSMKDFMNKCTACGGNWGAMLLTGIKRVFPYNYEEVEKEYNSMDFSHGGVYPFMFLCEWLTAHGIYSEDKS